ncbi:NAD(P)-binding protein [Aureobasidium subglaciale]|nr:NAD(P)-binding protein [Aureobasidium subglaciale]KAI5223887.1 NAD(P)-binding protein [Aureobasidium subglaciale]KAI5227426.1 NAD(P)-binding protein [Aureobasidium subglaciale]KAI5262665.1 NAD(P)-binding protein [Aureobasidium subglaciale]
MSTETIVLTGATGFCGFAILQEALQYDYNIRIVVRSAAKADILRNNPCFKSLTRGTPRYSFHIVPDLGVEGALDEVTAGAQYMIHTASPLPFSNVNLSHEEQRQQIIDPAVNNTIGALQSAKKSGSVKRVVITSSCAVFIRPELLGGPEDVPVVVTEDTINSELPPPYANNLVAYVASKVSAFLQSKQWMADNKPGFDVVNVCPTFVQGRNELATSPADLMNTSNALLLRMVLGLAPKDSPAEYASVVHIEDVAAIHIAALNKDRIPAGDYMFGQEVRWNDINTITKEMFPEQVAQGLLPCTSNVPTKSVVCSKEKTERTFDVELKGVEDMVEDLVEQYLELSGQKRHEDEDDE